MLHRKPLVRTTHDLKTMSGRVPPRILSIQSHVVRGYVGNKAAVLPLQLLGFEVDAINSVQFSNHTAYTTVKGTAMTGEELWDLVEGLEANELLTGYTHLLTGYIGSTSLLRTIARLVQKLRQYNPDLIYVCDPVMGDDGRLYVKPELPAAFKSDVVPLATILTPNAFEVQQLTGITVTGNETALTACQQLHQQGPTTVVITSASIDGLPPGHLAVFASTTLPQRDGKPRQLRWTIPKLEGYFTGTGDLCAALILAWLHQQPDDLSEALNRVLSTLQAVLKRTSEGAGNLADSIGQNQKAAARELRLVGSEDLLLEPAVTLHSQPIGA